MDTEYDFIVNPKARSGMGEMIWRMLEPELKKDRVAYHVHMTRRRGHAGEIAEALTSDGAGTRSLYSAVTGQSMRR